MDLLNDPCPKCHSLNRECHSDLVWVGDGYDNSKTKRVWYCSDCDCELERVEQSDRPSADEAYEEMRDEMLMQSLERATK